MTVNLDTATGRQPSPGSRDCSEPRRQRTNLWLLWVSQFANTAGLMMLVPIMPLYVRDLGASPASAGIWAGAAIAAPALPLALVTPIWGRLGDRVGQKWMVVRALIGLAAAMALMAIASGPLALLVARLAQGTLGGVVEAAAAFVGSDAEEEGRASAMGRSYSATAAGALAGPVAGGLLMSTGRLDWLLLAIAGSALVLALLCVVFLKGRARGTPGRSGDRSRHDGRATRSQIGWALLAAGALMFFGVYGLIPVYAEYVASLVGQPSQAGPWIGVLHAVMWAGTLVGSLFWGRFNDRHESPLPTMFLASAVTAGSMFIQAWTPWLGVLIPLRFAQGFAFAALAQSLLLHASLRAPEHRRAEFVGTANSCLLIGQFLGPLVAGAMLAALPPSATATVSSVAVAAGAVLVWREVRRRNTRKRGQPPSPPCGSAGDQGHESQLAGGSGSSRNQWRQRPVRWRTTAPDQGEPGHR